MHRRHGDEHTEQRMLEFVSQLCPEANVTAIRAGGLLLRVAHAFYQLNESSLAEVDLTLAQYRLLTQLLYSEQFHECNGLNPSTISEKQGVSRNTVSALVRTLEANGWVRRKLDEADRRRFIIELTDVGRELVRRHASRHFSTMSRSFTRLTPAEQETLIALLEKLGQNPHLDVKGI